MPIEVDLHLISESKLKIDGYYPYGESVDDALDNLDGPSSGIEAVFNVLARRLVPGTDMPCPSPARRPRRAVRDLKKKMEAFRRDRHVVAQRPAPALSLRLPGHRGVRGRAVGRDEA